MVLVIQMLCMDAWIMNFISILQIDSDQVTFEFVVKYKDEFHFNTKTNRRIWMRSSFTQMHESFIKEQHPQQTNIHWIFHSRTSFYSSIRKNSVWKQHHCIHIRQALRLQIFSKNKEYLTNDKKKTRILHYLAKSSEWNHILCIVAVMTFVRKTLFSIVYIERLMCNQTCEWPKILWGPQINAQGVKSILSSRVRRTEMDGPSYLEWQKYCVNRFEHREKPPSESDIFSKG